MKMRERCPAHVLPCNLQVSVLICLLLVSLLVTNTLGSYQIKSNILPGYMMARNLSSSSTPSSPPTMAHFLMECWPPSGSVSDHCWLDNDTMVLVDFTTSEVVKATINKATKTCTYSHLNNHSLRPMKVACSPDGEEIYVVDYYNSVWVYDRNSSKAIWYPEGLVSPPYTVAMNRKRIMIGSTSRQPLYVYNRNRVYQGQISINENQFQFIFTGLTEEGVFVGTTGSTDPKLVIHDIPHASTIIAGQFYSPGGVSIVGDYFLVCDYFYSQVQVFSQKGEFQGNLQFHGTDVSQPNTIAYRSEAKLLSLPVGTISHIKIFSLT